MTGFFTGDEESLRGTTAAVMIDDTNPRSMDPSGWPAGQWEHLCFRGLVSCLIVTRV